MNRAGSGSRTDAVEQERIAKANAEEARSKD